MISLVKGGLTMYTILLIGVVFGGGSLIRLYGNVCGLSIMEPYTWANSMMLMGSPVCRCMNWAVYASMQIMEYIWLHMAALVVGHITTTFPSVVITRKSVTNLNSDNSEYRKSV